MRSTSNRKFAIIGIGTFGAALIKQLVAQNIYVIAVDKNMEPIEKIKSEVAEAVSFDATNSELLHKMGITDADVVVISVGDDFKAAEFIAMELQSQGIHHVYVTVNSEREEQIMRKIGIAEVINPEVQAAEQLAELLTPGES